MLRNWLKKFRRNESGVSAVEFALVSPVFMFALLGVVDIGYLSYQRGDMESALRSGIQYFMNGGEDLSLAQSVVETSWTTRPVSTTILAERYCMCGTEVHVCNTLCADATYPDAYNRLTASAVFEGILMDEQHAASQTVRVR